MPPSDAPAEPDMPSNLPPPSQGPNKRLQQNQAQVDEVVDIMKVNMEKVLERDSKLSKLDERADALQAGASQFEASAGKLKNKFWWKNMKMNIMIGGVVLLVLIVAGWSFFGGKKAAPVQVVQAPNEPASEKSTMRRMRRDLARGISINH